MLIQQRAVEPDIVLVEIAGRLALGRESQRVEWGLEDVMKAGPKKIVFDLSKLEYLDSTCIGILIVATGYLPDGRTFQLLAVEAGESSEK